MNVQISNLTLPQVLDFKELKELFRHFAELTKIDVALHDVQGNELLSYRVNPRLSICEVIKDYENLLKCKKQMEYAGLKAAELGEPYIFKCGCMIKSSAPIFFEEKYIGSLSCGPVLLWEPDELAMDELRKITHGTHLNEDQIQEIMKNVKQLSCDNMTSASQMLNIIVNHMCKEESKFLAQRLKIYKQQKEIGELIQEKKLRASKLMQIEKRSLLQRYPIETEKELIASIQTGNTANARKILNEVLGEIFAISSGNLDIIKAKLFELITIFFRAGIDAGAPLSDMAIILKDYTKVFSEEIKFEEMCLMSSEVMEMIMGVIYQHRSQKKTNEHLTKAIAYIKQNYHQNLSLETVANQVYVSTYYLSHLFREELNMTFSDYLNKIRMEHALDLIHGTGKNVQMISETVGFNDASYFSKIFKKHYGVSPNSYLKLFKG